MNQEGHQGTPNQLLMLNDLVMIMNKDLAIQQAKARQSATSQQLQQQEESTQPTTIQKIGNFCTMPIFLLVLFALIFVASIVVTKIKTDPDFYEDIHDPLYYPEIYDLVLLNSTSAVCLDGSPASYYISRNGDPNKIYLYFQGGGWCQGSNYQETLQQCYQRSKTFIGSSLLNTKQIQFGQGVFSNDSRNNFKDWKRVKLNYCDGSGHQGTKSQPIQFQDTKLYFRGHNITVQTLQDLQNKIGLFSKAQQVFVTGQSAGGLAAYMWANYITDRVQKGTVHIAPVSGIFYDSQNVQTQSHLLRFQYKNLMQIVNQQIDPPVPECLKNHPLEKERCMFAQNIIEEIKAPLFIVQPLYDAWSQFFILGIRCLNGLSIKYCTPSQRMILQENRRNILQLVDRIKRNPKNGAWVVACTVHMYAISSAYYNDNFRIPSGSQNSISSGIQKWLQNSTPYNFYIDDGKWPVNQNCAGINQFL